MLLTEKILEQYGLNMQDVSRKFDGIEELIVLLQEPITAETSAIIQTIDLRVSQSLDRNKLAKLSQKVEKKEFDIEEAQSNIAKTGIVSGFFDDDELDNLLGSGLDISEGETIESVKMLIRKTFSKIDISEFFLYLGLGKVPMISEDLNLIARSNGIVVEGIFNDQFKATLQVQAEPIISLHGMRVNVTFSSYDRTLLEGITFGNAKPFIEEIEADLPKQVGDAEMSSLFFSQVFDKKSYRFDYIKSELDSLDDKFSTWDLPIGALINPELTRFSNYYLKPNYLYSLVKKGSLKQVGLREGSYITNSCKESKASGFVIYERGGSANLNFTFRGKQINDFVSVDEQFESFVAPMFNEALENGKKADLIGFSPINANGKSGINHGGYFVHSADSLPDFMFVPAVIVNYFKKYHEINEVRAFDNEKDSRTIIFQRGSLVVGLYELPRNLIVTLQTVSQVYPTNASIYEEVVYSKHTLNFLNKIDLLEVLGISELDESEEEIIVKTDREIEVDLEEMEFDESWQMVYEDAESLIEMYLSDPDETIFRDYALSYIELLEENGFEAQAKELKNILEPLNVKAQQGDDLDDLDDLDNLDNLDDLDDLDDLKDLDNLEDFDNLEDLEKNDNLLDIDLSDL